MKKRQDKKSPNKAKPEGNTANEIKKSPVKKTPNKKAPVRTKTLSNDFKEESHTKVRVLIIIAVILAVALFFVVRSQTGVNRLRSVANKYMLENNIEVEDVLIIEAIELEEAGFSTRLREDCLKESYVLVERDNDEDKLNFTPKIVCADTEPTIELIGTTPVTIEHGDKFEDPGATAMLADRDISDRIVVDRSNLNLSVLGSYTIRYSITDRNDNSAEVTRTVSVVDTVAPEISLIGGNVTVVQGLSFTEPGFTAIDNYDGVITNQVRVSGNVNINVVGNYVLTYTVSDSSDNEARVTRTVTVREPVAPRISFTIGTQVEADRSATFDNERGFTAWDERDGYITRDVRVTGTVNRQELGTYTLTYTVTASSGKTTTVTRRYTVVDTTAPTIDTSAIVFESALNGSHDFSGAFATDTFDNSPSLNIDYTQINLNEPGNYQVIFTAEDASGNIRTVTKTFVVYDINVIGARLSLQDGFRLLPTGTLDGNGDLVITNYGVNNDIIRLNLTLSNCGTGCSVSESITIASVTYNLDAVTGDSTNRVYSFVNGSSTFEVEITVTDTIQINFINGEAIGVNNIINPALIGATITVPLN